MIDLSIIKNVNFIINWTTAITYLNNMFSHQSIINLMGVGKKMEGENLNLNLINISTIKSPFDRKSVEENILLKICVPTNL